MREFAIINTNDEDFSANILKFLPSDSEITVFRTRSYDFPCPPNVRCVEIPKEIVENHAKIRNFVSKYYFDRKFCGFLHVIEDRVEILKDVSSFLDKIEEMMVKLNQKSWFNTETDPCNYTFKVFNPRISVAIDEPEARRTYDKTVYWTSHANTSWICYDFSKVEFGDIRFEERFTIAMFYIIEFLARRRNSKGKGELYYMNYYPTISEERGVFRLREDNPYVERKSKTKEDFERENVKMGEENALFASMNVNHSPDTSVEQVIEDMYSVLVAKTQKDTAPSP